MQAIPQSIALALFQAIPQPMLFHAINSFLEIGSIVFTLYVSYRFLSLVVVYVVVNFCHEREETSLLDKICGFGLDDNGVLHGGYAGSKEERTGRIRFADKNEMVLFNYGMKFHCKGASRRQIKKALKQAAAVLQEKLLDDIFNTYMEGDTLMVPWGGETIAIACEHTDTCGDLIAKFPDSLDWRRFVYGLALRGKGCSRTEVKREMKRDEKILRDPSRVARILNESSAEC